MGGSLARGRGAPGERPTAYPIRGRPERGSGGGRDLLERRGGERQVDHEGRAVAGLGLDADAAAVALDDAVREREAEAGADADRLGGEERIEDARLHFGRNARPAVAELERDAAVAAARLDADLTLAVDRIA